MLVNILINVITNILADIIFWIGLGALVAVYVKITQARFQKFFGLADRRKLLICLSNLWHIGSTTSSPFGRPYYHIGLNELRASQALASLFSTSLLKLPDVVSGLVDSIWSSDTKKVETIISEPFGFQTHNEYQFGTVSLVIIGGSRWNSLRAVYVDKKLPVMQFSHEGESASSENIKGQAVIIQRGPGSGDRVESVGLALGILEKLKDPVTKNTVFFCVGSRGDISRAVTEFLVKNWRHLNREFGDKEFGICLGFPAVTDHLDVYVEPLQLRQYRA